LFEKVIKDILHKEPLRCLEPIYKLQLKPISQGIVIWIPKINLLELPNLSILLDLPLLSKLIKLLKAFRFYLGSTLQDHSKFETICCCHACLQKKKTITAKPNSVLASMVIDPHMVAIHV
jgi:hypothetical protein